MNIQWIGRALCAVSPLLGGCVSTAPPTTDSCHFNQQTLAESLAQRSAGKGVRPFQILVLSGGGAYGAWGAGVLRGWRQNTAEPRREAFDVVTAISTGALQASHAFLGETRDDDALEKAYTTLGRASIYRLKFPLWPWISSIYDTAPLRRQIAAVVTNETIDRVGAEAAHGRRLYVGTTNLDRSTLTVWDMTCLASSGRADRYERYRTILQAATAIPVLFPPVRIDGELHADGGTRADLFLDRTLLPIVHAGKTISFRPRVFILLNGVAPGTTEPVANRLIPLAARAIENMLSSAQQADVTAIASLGRAEGFDVLLSAIPAAVSGPSSALDFDPVAMRSLYDSAAARARTGAWIDLTSDAESERAK